jgi:hypothetical protein
MSQLRLLCLTASVLAAGLFQADYVASQNTDVWRSQVEFGFSGASGNTDFSILRLGASVVRTQQEEFELEVSGRVRWGTSDGNVIANDMETTAKFDWAPQSDWSPFVFATAGRDRVRNVNGRVLGGGGAKWTFSRWGEVSKASLSLAAVRDYESFHRSAGSAARGSESAGRWSLRFKADHRFGSSATFQHVLFWQPRMSDAKDYVLDLETSVSTELLTNLSLVVSHSYIHDEIPPPEAFKDDMRLEVVLRVRL